MYEVYCERDGVYSCVASGGGEINQWTKKTLEEAIESLIQFAKTRYGGKIGRENIDIIYLGTERVEITD